MKYLGINIIKCAQELYGENYKTLIKEIKELNKWRYSMFMDKKIQYHQDSFLPS